MTQTASPSPDTSADGHETPPGTTIRPDAQIPPESSEAAGGPGPADRADRPAQVHTEPATGGDGAAGAGGPKGFGA